MAIIHFLPKLTVAVPASLAAIVTVTLLVIGLDLDARYGAGRAARHDRRPGGHHRRRPAELQHPLGALHLGDPADHPALLRDSRGVGLIESLLTLSLIDELTETRGRGNRECVGQGVANIGQRPVWRHGRLRHDRPVLINIKSGGRGRLSGIFAALFLLAFILFGSSLIEMIPVAALVGVMFMVVIGTFEWASFRLFGKVPLADTFVVDSGSGGHRTSPTWPSPWWWG